MQQFLSHKLIFVSASTLERDRCFPGFLDSTVVLRKCPCKCLNAIRDPLELILLLACNLVDDISRTVVVAIAPLDLRRVEIDLHICAVDVLGCARGKTTQGGDKTKELLDVVAELRVSEKFAP